MPSKSKWVGFFAAVVVLAATGCAVAQAEDVGTVAVASGEAEIGRAGAFQPAQAGMAVRIGDELRTGDGKLRVVLRDDSVLNLAENTQLVVDEQVFRPEEGKFNSLLRLIRGKVRSAVGAYYQQSGAVYEVETPTAVAGVRGTTFLVEYDPESKTTDVLGIRGRVGVRNLAADLHEMVYVEAQQATYVGKDRPPTVPEMLDEQHYKQRLDSMDIIGRTGFDSVVAGMAVQSGASVAAPDRAPLGASTLTGVDDPRDASDVVGQPIPVIESDRGRLGVPF